jgi:hypothetical protein
MTDQIECACGRLDPHALFPGGLVSHNLRWLLFVLGICIFIYAIWVMKRAAKVTDADERFSARRRGLVAALAGLVLAWMAAEIPPFKSWGVISWTRIRDTIQLAEAPQALAACAAYLAIVVISSRGLIGMPQYRMLQSRAEELRGLVRTIDQDCTTNDAEKVRSIFERRIAEAEGAARIKKLGIVIAVPLPSLLRATRTMNNIEKQMLFELGGDELRLAARQIAANLPATKEGKALCQGILTALQNKEDGPIRDECVAALITIQRRLDEPQAKEAARIRVAMWLTVVGLAAIYALSVTFSELNEALIAGALGGMLGSLSALILRQELSLGLIVLSPVAGALNAVGGLLLVSFLAKEEIQLLGAVFRDAWDAPTTVTALAVALLLGFSGGLFSRIAVAGVSPLLGTTNGTTSEDDKTDAGTSARETPRLSGDAKVGQEVEHTNGAAPKSIDVTVKLLPRRSP